MTLHKCDKCGCTEDVASLDQLKDIVRVTIDRDGEYERMIIIKDYCKYCFTELERFLNITK